jgi:hypothetical protein
MIDEHKQVALSQALCRRAHDLLISPNFAQQQLGFIRTNPSKQKIKEPKRTMLEVEKQAAAKRLEHSTNQQRYVDKVNERLHRLIDADIYARLEDFDYIYHDLMAIDDSVPLMLDTLAMPSVTVTRLEPYVAQLPWLAKELLSLLNTPRFRNQKQKNNKINVDTPALALRYLGIENLQTVIPTFAMRHWMPHSTAPFPLLKHKLRQWSMATAIAAKEIAMIHGVNKYQAYTLGMMLDIGKIVATHLYLKSFKEIWQSKVTQAREEGKKDLYSALVDLKHDPVYLRNLLLKNAVSISQKIISTMSLQQMPFNTVLEEFTVSCIQLSKVKVTELQPLTQVLLKATSFAQYLALKENQLIEDDEKRIWFDYIGFTEMETDKLGNCNFSSLQLELI